MLEAAEVGDRWRDRKGREYVLAQVAKDGPRFVAVDIESGCRRHFSLSETEAGAVDGLEFVRRSVVWHP